MIASEINGTCSDMISTTLRVLKPAMILSVTAEFMNIDMSVNIAGARPNRNADKSMIMQLKANITPPILKE